MGTFGIEFLILGSEAGSTTTRPLLSSSQEQSEPNTPIYDPISDRRLSPPPQFENSRDQIIAIEEPDDKNKKPPEVVISVSNLGTEASVSDRKSHTLGSPSRAKVSPSPSPSLATDKGKSKITGKSVSGWI